MNHSLNTYLHDHIAGAEAALAVINFLLENIEEPVLVRLLGALHPEIQEDKAVLEKVAASVGSGPSVLKNSAAWISAKAVELKIRARNSPFGAFEGLEFISLGIQGKLHLWKALQRSPGCASADVVPDYSSLIQRAEDQHQRVEGLRLALASIVL